MFFKIKHSLDFVFGGLSGFKSKFLAGAEVFMGWSGGEVDEGSGEIVDVEVELLPVHLFKLFFVLPLTFEIGQKDSEVVQVQTVLVGFLDGSIESGFGKDAFQYLPAKKVGLLVASKFVPWSSSG